jgi:hypothetical protein
VPLSILRSLSDDANRPADSDREVGTQAPTGPITRQTRGLGGNLISRRAEDSLDETSDLEDLFILLGALGRV